MGYERHAAALATAFAFWLSPAKALADGASRGVPILDLDDAAAREIATRLACASPKVARYYGPMLRDLAGRRWGLLRRTFQQGTIDLVGDAVYESATRGTGEPLTMSSVAGGGKARRSATCTEADADAARAALVAAPTPADVATCSAKPPAERRRDPSCALAKAVTQAMAGDVDETQLRLADLVAAAAFPAIYDGGSLSEAQQNALFEHVGHALRAVARRERGDRTIDDDIEKVFETVEVDEVHPERCDDRDVVELLAIGGVDDTEEFCVATRASFDLDKIPVVVTAPSGARHETTLAAVVEDLIPDDDDGGDDDKGNERGPQTDSEAAHALVCSLPLSAGDRTAAACDGGAAPAARATFEISVGSVTWSAHASPGKDGAQFTALGGDGAGLLALVEGASDASELRSDVVAFIRTQLLGEPPPPAAIRELSVAALRVRHVANALGRLPLETDDHAYLVGTIEALPAIAGSASGRPVPAVEPPDCARAAHPLARLRCLARPSGALRHILVDAENARVRDVAVQLGDAFFGHAGGDVCDRAHGRFFTALAAYSLDDGTRASDAQSDLLAADQLRAAAADVQACTGRRGIERTSSSEVARVGLDLLPSPAMRVSWNNGYRNEATGDGYRILPSVDWLVARVRLAGRTASSYTGLQISLADLAAPFSELALRRGDASYAREGALWLELLKPRIELTFGMPAAARNVLLSAGMSLRTAVPFPDSNGLTYVTIDRASGDQLASFVEYNVGAKWVF